MDRQQECSVNMQTDLKPVNLFQEKSLLTADAARPPEPNLPLSLRKKNCSSNIIQCTMTNVPKSELLLKQVKLPLAFIFHPFSHSQEPCMISNMTLPQCTQCRAYINPFVTFLNQQQWKCVACLALNTVPGAFLFDQETGGYQDSQTLPVLQHPVVEFYAPPEYLDRPPQPTVYLFAFDVSSNAMDSGYLQIVCQTLLENLDRLPGSHQTRIGIITFDSTVHFYNLQEGLTQPRMMIVSDTEDVVVPDEERLLVNLFRSRELIMSLLKALPKMFRESSKTECTLGLALQAAQKLLSSTGGRLSVFVTQLPNTGCGELQCREDADHTAGPLGWQQLAPATDFYKDLALECCAQHIAVDLFLLSGQYSDLASLSCLSRYTCGSVYYYPKFHYIYNEGQVEKLQRELQHYLTRLIGTEALLRISYTQGLVFHALYGNSFLQSSDQFSLPVVTQDTVLAVQMLLDDKFVEWPFMIFQSSLLYTSIEGERLVRIQTYCLPIVNSLTEVYAGIDVVATMGMLSNIAVDSSFTSSQANAKEDLVDTVSEILATYKSISATPHTLELTVPHSLQRLPLYALGLLKMPAFQTDALLTLDERIFAMYQLMTQPLPCVMPMIYPDLYRIDTFIYEVSNTLCYCTQFDILYKFYT
ncbi:protein transport protein Sec24A-like [Latimeria chalumnae]|uniref:protein transport protein Sec24A-like n=1 Tax=Latimeria chalumnae TaxID=7897 RepID=UPI00313E321E